MNIMTISASGAFRYVMQHFPEPGITEYPKRTDTYAVISIQDTAHGGFGFELKENDYCKGVLTLYFDDIEKPQQDAKRMTEGQAAEIIQFIIVHTDDVDTLLIHCFAEISRSRAVERFAREILALPPMNDKIYNEYVYSTLNRVWKESYLQSFAIIFLHAQDTAEQWVSRLHEAKFYHSQLSENTVLIFNIRYEDAERLAKQSFPRSFLFGDCTQGRIMLRSMKWGLMTKNKGRLRRGYIDIGSCDGPSLSDSEFHSHLTAYFIEYGLSFTDVQSEISNLLVKLKQKQQRLGCNDVSMMTFLRKSMDDDYYAKGRFFSRATIYHT